jgi:hypothetical protein
VQIFIASTSLCSGGRSGPTGLTVAGQKLTDDVQLIRASELLLWDRGGKSVVVSFGVQHEFNSVSAAQKWLLESWGLLPNEGDVTFFCDDDQEVYMLGAQLEAQIVSPIGVTVRVQYTLRGPPPQSSNPPAVVPDPDAVEEDPVIQRARVAIPSASEGEEITFASAFAAAPVVVVSVNVPAGSPQITAEVVKDSETTLVFSYRLSAETPNANYTISYIAIAPAA